MWGPYQVVVNGITNALKHTKAGTVQLHVSARSFPVLHTCATVTVHLDHSPDTPRAPAVGAIRCTLYLYTHLVV